MKRWTFALLAAGLLALSGQAAAAGFDCALPTLTATEHMICDTPALSTLDDQLSAAYKQSRTRDKAAATAQRQWMSDVRNKCTTTACLETAYSRRIAELEGGDGACAVTEATLSGTWENTGKGGREFDSLAFLVEAGAAHSFVSWLHSAPFATGTWTLQDCKIHVKGSGDRDDYDFIVQGLAGGVLRLKDVVDDDTLEFRKSKQQSNH